jgi:predicted phage tail component-like protein
MTGFKFKNIHSSTFGVVSSTSRPLLPAVKVSEVTPDFCDGSIDFSDSNEHNRYMYSDRVFEVCLQVSASDIYRLLGKLEDVKSWLIGKGELIFDDSPDRIWSARVLQEIPFAPQLLGLYAELAISFRVEPFAYGIEQNYTKELTGGVNVISFDNDSTFYTPPILELHGSATTISVKDFNARLTGSESDTVVIDNELREVYTDAGYITDYCNQKFFELEPGEQSLSITVDADTECTISFKPRYI